MGHVLRMKSDEIKTNGAELDAIIEKKTGRPWESWRYTAEKQLATILGNCKKVARDWQKWKELSLMIPCVLGTGGKRR